MERKRTTTRHSPSTMEKIIPIKWSVGDCIWAKFSGYPWWPCMVTKEEQSNDYTKIYGRFRMYHVQYFGDGYETGWVYSSSTLKFEGNKAFKQHTKDMLMFAKKFEKSSLETLYKIPSHWTTALNIAIQEGEMSLQLCPSARLLKYGLTTEHKQDFCENLKIEIDNESLCVKDRQSIEKRKTSDDNNLHSGTKYKKSKITKGQIPEPLWEQTIQEVKEEKSDKLSSDEDKDEQNKSSIEQQDVHSNSIVQEEEYKPECVVYTSFICEQISPKLTYGETEGSLFKDGDTTSHSCTESENHTDLSTENQLDSENNNCSDFKFKYQKNDTVCSWYSVDFPNINYGSNYELENKNYIASYRSNYYGYSSRESHSELDSLNKTAVHSEDYLDLGNNNTELKNQIITAASSEENLDFRNENNKSENKNSTEVLNKDYLEFRKSSKSTELMNKNRTDISSEEYLDSKNNYNKYKSQNETDVSSEEYLDLKNNNNKSKSQNETDVFSEEYLELKNSDNKAKSHKETDVSRLGSASENCSCIICGKIFKKSCNLRIHMRKHSGEKPYICGICEKGFSQSSSLNTHTKLKHSTDKSYVCDVCGKTFAIKSYLDLHFRTHTKEKPYSCEICFKSFSQRSSLTTHNKTHKN